MATFYSGLVANRAGQRGGVTPAVPVDDHQLDAKPVDVADNRARVGGDTRERVEALVLDQTTIETTPGVRDVGDHERANHPLRRLARDTRCWQPPAAHDIAAQHRRGTHCLLEQPVEHQPARTCLAPVEPDVYSSR
jgi:hypothetical protein